MKQNKVDLMKDYQKRKPFTLDFITGLNDEQIEQFSSNCMFDCILVHNRELPYKSIKIIIYLVNNDQEKGYN